MIDKPILGEDTYLDPLFADGLVGCWLFNEGSGNKVFDLSGNGNTGAFQGTAPSWSAGKFGPAILLPGTDEYITTPVITLSSFSFVSWIKTTDNTEWAGIISTDDSSGNFAQIVISDTGSLRYDIGAGDDRDRGDGAIVINDGNWHHIALVRNNPSDINKLYVDAVNDTVDVSHNTVDSFSVTEEIQIGITRDLIVYFNGKIDHATIWNRALSVSEIALLYRESFWGFKQRDSGIYTRI